VIVAVSVIQVADDGRQRQESVGVRQQKEGNGRKKQSWSGQVKFHAVIISPTQENYERLAPRRNLFGSLGDKKTCVL
jgi:hypothetical protein